ncbi:response regulator transcription factor [Prolixibacteraceae bacterium JC049]|nr:response regulator transcription factor [Prolixibacteraceae bacterium JC049]
MKILLAEDDIDLGNVLSQFLEISGFEVLLARDGKEGLELFNHNKVDICILDVMMPEMDGFTLGKHIRKQNETVPFIFLTARNQKDDILTGLKLGADDYITKPFEVEELVLRIQNILKRSQKSEPENLELHSICLLFDEFKLKTPSGEYRLTQKEAELLRYLILNKNKVLKREQILTELWGENDYFLGRSMDVFISRIRKYLKDDSSLVLDTIRGVGYILNAH